MSAPLRCRCGESLAPAAFVGGTAVRCPGCARLVAAPIAPPPDDTEEQDDYPRPVRRRQKSSGPSPAILITIGAAVLIGLLAIGGLVYAVTGIVNKPRPSSAPAVAANDPIPNPQPIPQPINPRSPQPKTRPSVVPTSVPKTSSTPAEPPPSPMASKGWPPKWSNRSLAELVVGDWEIDLPALPSFKREQFANSRLRFGADGEFRGVLPGGELIGRWAATESAARILKFRLTATDRAKQPDAVIQFSVLFTSDDHLEYEALVPRDPSATVRTRFKRAGSVSLAGPTAK